MDAPPQPFSLRTKLLYALVLTLALAGFGWYQLFYDEPPRHPPGLVLPEPLPPVADADNGLVYLADEVEKETWPEIESGTGGHTEVIHWRAPWDAEKMQPLVDAAPAARALLEKALTFPAWRAESGPGTRSFTSETQLVQNLIQAKIRHLAETDKVKEAMNWLEPLGRFAQRQGETPTSLANVLMWVGATRVVDALRMRLLALPGISEAMLERGSRWLDAPSASSDDLIQAMARDYLREKSQYFDFRDNPKLDLVWLFDLIQDTQKVPPEWFIRSRIKPQAYHNLMLEHFALLGQLNHLSGMERRAQLKASHESIQQAFKLSLWSLDPKRGSKILAAAIGPANSELLVTLDTVPAYRDCCRAAIAAKRWSLAHGGEQVKSLTELVPQFLPAVPMDPYDNQPLKWDAATSTVYVIGEDGVDNLPDFKPGQVSTSGKKGIGVRWPTGSGGL